MKLKSKRLKKKYAKKIAEHVLFIAGCAHMILLRDGQEDDGSYYIWYDRMDDAFPGAQRMLPFRTDILQMTLEIIATMPIVNWEAFEALSYDDQGILVWLDW